MTQATLSSIFEEEQKVKIGQERTNLGHENLGHENEIKENLS